MKLNRSVNQVVNQIFAAKRWLVGSLLCTLALISQVGLSAPVLAAPNLLAADLGDQVQQKTREDAGRAKDFIRDTADKVKETANKNANRVDQATDNDSAIERKAKRDRDRIEQRANEDAARTERAVDETKNAVERAVDGIKDAFN